MKDLQSISKEDYNLLKNNQIDLPIKSADHMIENYILNYDLLLGLAMNFMIDGKKVLIPMGSEEPSVIAAASNAGKLKALSKYFYTEMDKGLVIGQIVLKNIDHPDKASLKLKEMLEKFRTCKCCTPFYLKLRWRC